MNPVLIMWFYKRVFVGVISRGLMMGFLQVAVLLAVATSLVGCQSDCGISVVPLWSTHDNNITQLYCDLSNAAPKWWVVSDPCQQSSDSATELTECSGQGGCIVPNDLMTSSLGCVVCCTDSRISSQFTINSVGSCTELRVCPEVTIFAPTITTTGTDVDILTFVTTKPRPSPGDVSVQIQTAGVDVPIVARDEVYPAPGGNSNNHTIVHTLKLSQAADIAVPDVLIFVDWSEVPTDATCLTMMDGQGLKINLIKVNSSRPTPDTPQPNTTQPSPDPSGVGPRDDPLRLHTPSLAIGIGAGVGATIVLVVVIGIIILGVRHARASGKKEFSSSDHGHLLTGNSTPAVTPGSDVNQSLGQHSETPASTPTELHDLLPQPTDASPYQEIHLNGSARVPTTVGSSQEQSTTFGQGTDNRPPLPRHPLPVHVPNPPRFTQVSFKTPSTQSLTDPHYHTQGEAINLSHQYNVEGVLQV